MRLGLYWEGALKGLIIIIIIIIVKDSIAQKCSEQRNVPSLFFKEERVVECLISEPDYNSEF